MRLCLLIISNSTNRRKELKNGLYVVRALIMNYFLFSLLLKSRLFYETQTHGNVEKTT